MAERHPRCRLPPLGGAGGKASPKTGAPAHRVRSRPYRASSRAWAWSDLRPACAPASLLCGHRLQTARWGDVCSDGPGPGRSALRGQGQPRVPGGKVPRPAAGGDLPRAPVLGGRASQEEGGQPVPLLFGVDHLRRPGAPGTGEASCLHRLLAGLSPEPPPLVCGQVPLLRVPHLPPRRYE